ncbi:hypothetical protein [Pseudomonas aeruginosa]|jgi:hypothetical protein|uniref:hypothetical protein n=1 Tax=Pseudomonas aeruginosa TaxID=287 RepID=UPI002358E3CB|nr:hypothetical protein [Pseudomonas aeruginosa]MDY1449803.1 hypothetical protein [Pseudomonas aeruginosa]HEJ2935049.1 hypothetical protein [Pseudomonas aeruginosa]
MRTLYLDTEFTSLSLDRRLISLALVAEDGAEFYVELLDGWPEDACSEFTVETVLPQLALDTYGLTRAEASIALRDFLSVQGAVEIAGDALDWDWPLLLELLGSSGLPDNVVGCRAAVPFDPSDDLDVEDAPHHALLDARLICRLASKPQNR